MQYINLLHFNPHFSSSEISNFENLKMGNGVKGNGVYPLRELGYFFLGNQPFNPAYNDIIKNMNHTPISINNIVPILFIVNIPNRFKNHKIKVIGVIIFKAHTPITIINTIALIIISKISPPL